MINKYLCLGMALVFAFGCTQEPADNSASTEKAQTSKTSATTTPTNPSTSNQSPNAGKQESSTTFPSAAPSSKPKTKEEIREEMIKEAEKNPYKDFQTGPSVRRKSFPEIDKEGRFDMTMLPLARQAQYYDAYVKKGIDPKNIVSDFSEAQLKKELERQRLEKEKTKLKPKEEIKEQQPKRTPTARDSAALKKFIERRDYLRKKYGTDK